MIPAGLEGASAGAVLWLLHPAPCLASPHSPTLRAGRAGERDLGKEGTKSIGNPRKLPSLYS